MNPFDTAYVGVIAKEATTRRGRQASMASQKASARVEAMRASRDSHHRYVASGSIPGLGQRPDPVKTHRILKPANL